MRKSFRLDEIDCANCARKLQDELAALDGVDAVSVNFLTQKLTLTAADERFDEVLDRVVALDQSHLVVAGTPREVFSPENEERLTRGGLGIPRSLRVARELERRGWPALGEPLTTDELVAAISETVGTGTFVSQEVR